MRFIVPHTALPLVVTFTPHTAFDILYDACVPLFPTVVGYTRLRCLVCPLPAAVHIYTHTRGCRVAVTTPAFTRFVTYQLCCGLVRRTKRPAGCCPGLTRGRADGYTYRCLVPTFTVLRRRCRESVGDPHHTPYDTPFPLIPTVMPGFAVLPDCFASMYAGWWFIWFCCCSHQLYSAPFTGCDA